MFFPPIRKPKKYQPCDGCIPAELEEPVPSRQSSSRVPLVVQLFELSQFCYSYILIHVSILYIYVYLMLYILCYIYIVYLGIFGTMQTNADIIEIVNIYMNIDNMCFGRT